MGIVWKFDFERILLFFFRSVTRILEVHSDVNVGGVSYLTSIFSAMRNLSGAQHITVGDWISFAGLASVGNDLDDFIATMAGLDEVESRLMKGLRYGHHSPGSSVLPSPNPSRFQSPAFQSLIQHLSDNNVDMKPLSINRQMPVERSN